MKERERGEKLARIALDAGLAIKQLRNLFDVVKTESLDYVEDFIRYKMTKIDGYWEFGTETLKILTESRDKEAFMRVLERAIMLHDYLDARSFMDLEPEVSENLQRFCQRYGYEGIKFSIKGKENHIDVFLLNFFGSRQQYSEEIYHHLMRINPKLRKHNFRVFIRQGGGKSGI